MQLHIYFIASFYQMFYNICHFTRTEGLIGDTVRSAEPIEFPFIVAIVKYIHRNNWQTAYKCAGSLISRNDVLTSEHCIEADNLYGMDIVVGSSNLNFGTRHYPEWWISYDQWAAYSNNEIVYTDNDIAILNLIERVANTIEPAVIWISSLRTLFGIRAQTAGWGLISNGTVPHVLQTVSLVILTNTECEARATRLIGRSVRVDGRTLCSISDPFALLRPGDSGAPIFFRNYILGVNFGTAPLPMQDFHPEKVNLHIHASYYYNFISDLGDNY